MAATTARIGFGTTLAYAAAGAGPTFVAVAEILDIKMPKHTATPVEVERYDNPNGPWVEKVTGWANAGEMEMTLTYNAAQAAGLWAIFNVAGQFQVTKPDGKKWTYQGILVEFGDTAPIKDKMTVEAKFSISGLPVPDTGSA